MSQSARLAAFYAEGDKMKQHPFTKAIRWEPAEPARMKFFDPLKAATILGGAVTDTRLVITAVDEEGEPHCSIRECVRFTPREVFFRYKRARLNLYERKVNAPLAAMRDWLNSLNQRSA